MLADITMDDAFRVWGIQNVELHLDVGLVLIFVDVTIEQMLRRLRAEGVPTSA